MVTTILIDLLVRSFLVIFYFRLWCICKQPHNNRFMICCDGCEDWFHGKCVNITKAMGQQMEEQGIEWRCPNCIKKAKPTSKNSNKVSSIKFIKLQFLFYV